MHNRLADFSPERFAISAYCPCGHSAQIDYRLLPPEMLVDSLRHQACLQDLRET